MTARATNTYNSDRELFSELFENPIHPLLFHIVPPYVNVTNATYDFQLNGEGIWKWRDVCGKPAILFDLIQLSILPFDYKLEESGRQRVGHALGESIHRFRKKIDSTTDGRKRREIKEKTWITLSIKPEEIEKTPVDVVAQLRQENGASSEEKAADLYQEMRKNLAHTGKGFAEVGKKQQKRHLTQIQ